MKTETTVVNKFKDDYDIYIGRGSAFGNPYTHKDGPSLAEFKCSTREEAILNYKKYFLEKVEADPVFRAKVLGIKGHRLGCFCKPLACHGDVIKEWLDSLPS